MWYCLHTAAGLRCGLSPRVRALHTHCDAGRFSDIRADLTVILLLCSMCAFLHAGRRVLHVQRFISYLGMICLRRQIRMPLCHIAVQVFLYQARARIGYLDIPILNTRSARSALKQMPHHSIYSCYDLVETHLFVLPKHCYAFFFNLTYHYRNLFNVTIFYIDIHADNCGISTWIIHSDASVNSARCTTDLP